MKNKNILLAAAALWLYSRSQAQTAPASASNGAVLTGAAGRETAQSAPISAVSAPPVIVDYSPTAKTFAVGIDKSKGNSTAAQVLASYGLDYVSNNLSGASSIYDGSGLIDTTPQASLDYQAAWRAANGVMVGAM
jgi:hypothetical protein